MVPPEPPRRLVVVADSDSYLKWACALTRRLPAGWQVRVLVLATPITPSPAQVEAAAGRRLTPVTAVGCVRTVLRLRPDAVLLACTGPVVQGLLEHPFLRGRRRPVLLTGLPGISHPPQGRGIRLRSGCDLFLLHSRRECVGYAALAAELGEPMDFALATLPFLTGRPQDDRGADKGEDVGEDVVFAAQAKVPARREDRERVLRALAGLPAPLHAVVKVRALTGERQTHHEAWSYHALWDGLVAREGWAPERITFRAGPMSAALERARAFVTVSSTAALEALDAGVPTLVLDDFGVSAELINLVFEGSGLLGDLDDLAAGRFADPDPTWRQDNYFHPAHDSTWVGQLEELVRRRREGRLGPARVRPLGRGRARLRRQARLLLPGTLWPVLERVRTGAGYRRVAPLISATISALSGRAASTRSASSRTAP